jgi:hypothetical protein
VCAHISLMVASTPPVLLQLLHGILHLCKASPHIVSSNVVKIFVSSTCMRKLELALVRMSCSCAGASCTSSARTGSKTPAAAWSTGAAERMPPGASTRSVSRPKRAERATGHTPQQSVQRDASESMRSSSSYSEELGQYAKCVHHPILSQGDMIGTGHGTCDGVLRPVGARWRKRGFAIDPTPCQMQLDRLRQHGDLNTSAPQPAASPRLQRSVVHMRRKTSDSFVAEQVRFFRAAIMLSLRCGHYAVDSAQLMVITLPAY